VKALAVAAVTYLGGCTPTARPAPETPIATKSADITTRTIEPAIVDDHITLVDFWSESCAACTVVGGRIAIDIAREDRIVIRKVDVGDGTTSIALDYGVSTLPHWKVYDRHKRLRYVLIGNETLRAPALARELLSEH
jgi:Thioredoxin